jgi:cytochrome c oxidase subunit 2
MASHDSPPETPRKAGGAVIGLLIFLVGATIVLFSSGLRVPQVLPENIGTHHGVDDLFWIIFWVTGFFFVLTEGLLIYYCVKYRAKEGGKAVHSHGNHSLEMLWSIVPGVILFGLAVMQTGSWGDIKYKSAMPSEDDAVVVQVIGRQFEWHFRYPGPDKEFGTTDDVVSPFHLYIPVDRDVIVKLQTLDVLHSFWLPNVRLKQDLVPGMTIPQWFKCVKTGDYEIVCAELCGSGHTKMKGNLHVLTADEFDAWLAKEKADQGDHVPADDNHWKYWYEKSSTARGGDE